MKYSEFAELIGALARVVNDEDFGISNIDKHILKDAVISRMVKRLYDAIILESDATAEEVLMGALDNDEDKNNALH